MKKRDKSKLDQSLSEMRRAHFFLATVGDVAYTALLWLAVK